MSEIRVDTFKAEDGISAPSFPNGIQVTGVVTATVLDSTVPFLNVGSNIQLGNAGVVTATSFSGTTGTFGDFVDIGSNIKLGNAGVVTATTFTGTTGTFSGNVSIGGTLTYEDVTNIDSVGLITARSGLVSPYADIDDFISVGSNIHLGNAGVCTATTFSGSGASLTNLNGSNIASGTVPTARLGSGTASSSTFLRGDSTFQTIVTDLVNDSSPQLGGNLDVNSKNIKFGDSGSSNDDRLQIGAATYGDMELFHDGTNSYIRNITNDLLIQNTGDDIYIDAADDIFIRTSTNEDAIKCLGDGAVEIYHNNSKKFESTSSGVTVTGTVSDSKGDLRKIIHKQESSAYTLVAADAGKAIEIASGGITVPSSVFGAGDAVTIINDSSSSQTITKGSGLNMFNSADATNSNRTLAGRGMATIYFVNSSTSYISGAGLS